MLNQSLGQTDIQESMKVFEQQYGINPDKDLFPYLDGKWRLAWCQREGIPGLDEQDSGGPSGVI